MSTESTNIVFFFLKKKQLLLSAHVLWRNSLFDNFSVCNCYSNGEKLCSCVFIFFF